MTPQTPSVLINGKVHIYRDKGPYIRAGKSVLGALEYDEAEDKLRCHLCGKWVGHLANHVVQDHNLTASEYKQKFGLRRRTALISEGTRAKISSIASKRGFAALRNTPDFRAKQLHSIKHVSLTRQERQTAEMLNSRMHCKAQLLNKLQTVAASLGHTPSVRECKESGLSWQALVHHFGSLTKAVRLAKLAPNVVSPGARERYSSEQLLELLRNFKYQVGRFPTASDMNRHMFGLPSQQPFLRKFGTLSAAIKQAARASKAKPVQSAKALSKKAGVA